MLISGHVKNLQYKFHSPHVNFYTPTIFTWDQCAHHVVMNDFLNANNNFRNKDLRKWNSKKKL